MPDRPILERERELAELASATRAAAEGTGSVVLVFGEAGIGKSSLLQTARSVLPAEGRLLVGYCDDLSTPRPFGPLRDLVGAVGAGLARALDASDRTRAPDALRAELDRPGQPTVLAVEDAHWADEATLDVLQFLVRRITALPAVLILTYRDDELGPEHPLHRLLGLASRTPGTRRLPLQKLSTSAVRRLTEQSALDPDDVYAVTAGNPFFVTEVVAAGGARKVPPTIADAVRGRVAGLPEASREALEQLAVLPSGVERWLLDPLLRDRPERPGNADRMHVLAAAEQHGLLTVTPQRVAFRHELARRAVADALPAARRMHYNRRVLRALVEHTEWDLSRIVHHAAEAGDTDAIVRYAPAAATEASRTGAHREAAAHLRLALTLRTRFPDDALAGLFEAYAVECYTLGQAGPALPAQQEAVALRRTLGDKAKLGTALRWLARIGWWANERPTAERAAEEGVKILRDAGEPALLAMAQSSLAQLHMLANRNEESVALAAEAVTVARSVDDPALLSHALNNWATAGWRIGDPDAEARLVESLRVALDAGETDHACRAYVNLVWSLIEDRRWDDADRYLTESIGYADGTEFVGFLAYLLVARGLVYLATGRWDEAVAVVEPAFDAQPAARWGALTVRGRIAVRRGLPEADDLIDQARQIAERMDEPLRIGPVAAARAEAAWLRGDRAAVTAVAAPAYDRLAGDPRDPVLPELYLWLAKAGAAPTGTPPPGRPPPGRPPPGQPPAGQATPPTGAPPTGRATPPAWTEPYVAQARGDWALAAEGFTELGCPYECAQALADSDDPDDLLAALSVLDGLGAEPLGRRVRARLRDVGVTRIPRGPTDTTRDNPAGLTERQLTVLRMVAEGLTNAQIAERLVVSTRTVDTHVGAVLDKFGVRNRRDAVAHAVTLGIVPGQSR
ncbi:AAA family ATPase [Virgisporangium ochraceum]|uniref:LuxR family transcriptional regulator n=1 Tax=Virgisporangium ochraceum TaxID=65505 RepID=A0A8J4EF03_9ACTN|nr:AAA family ATPase [Virgisporangium ochraceum]GIJ72309.1 LuxR family transcriptional regulator [Virgisporangium ochraceum]